MRNVTGPPVVGEDLFGRERELDHLWASLQRGEHVLMLAPRRVGKTSLMRELGRAPRTSWDVVHVDAEGCDGPADLFGHILAALASHDRYRPWLDAIPFSQAVKVVLGRLRSIGTGPLRFELAPALGREWARAADHLESRFVKLPVDRRLIIVVDELPILVARLLRTDGGHAEAEQLLAKLRQWRQAPELRGRVHTLIGGSIGLEGVLRRANLSASINDLTPFHLESWSRATAAAFLRGVGHTSRFVLDAEVVDRMLDFLRDPVPYHVQLFFSALRDACRADIDDLSLSVVERCFEQRLTGSSGTPYLDHYAGRLELAFDADEQRVARTVLDRACTRQNGVTFAGLPVPSPTLRHVLRELEADGYVLRTEGERVAFRSNLLRVWWRKHQALER